MNIQDALVRLVEALQEKLTPFECKACDGTGENVVSSCNCSLRRASGWKGTAKLAKRLGDAVIALENENAWRFALRKFACDSEQHRHIYDSWQTNSDGIGLQLYLVGGFYVAYHADAGVLDHEADDNLPMFHVSVQSDPPHRICIHPLHIHAWLEHLTYCGLPVRILDGDMLDADLDAEDEPPATEQRKGDWYSL